MAQIAYTDQMHLMALIRLNLDASTSFLAQAMELKQNPIPQRALTAAELAMGHEPPPTIDDQRKMVSRMLAESQGHALKVVEYATKLSTLVIINGEYVTDLGKRRAAEEKTAAAGGPGTAKPKPK